MKLNTSILMGILWLIIFIIDSHYMSFIFLGFGMVFIISGLFNLKNYQNNKLYLAIITVTTTITLILTYIQLLSPSYLGDRLINSIFSIIIALAIVWGAYDFTKKGKIIKNGSKWLNYILIAVIILAIIAPLAGYLQGQLY